MKFFDDKMKNVRWWNRNFFFLATILIIGINFALFYFMGVEWSGRPELIAWDEMFNFSNLINNFFSVFDHFNFNHLLLNMICFFVVGIFFERKYGSVNLILMTLLFAIVGKNMVGANHFGGWSIGFSIVNYAFYGFILIDFIFMFRRETRSVPNIIWGIFMIIFMYVSMAYNGGTIYPVDLKLSIYPVDLMYNLGHYTALLAGVILGLTLKIHHLEVFHGRDN